MDRARSVTDGLQSDLAARTEVVPLPDVIVSQDAYPTTTPVGDVVALFNADEDDGLGVRFDEEGPAAYFMRDLIRGSIGPGGIGLAPETLDGETYYDFCQPEGSGVTIEMPEYLRENPEIDTPPGPDGPAAMDAVTRHEDRVERARGRTNLTPTAQQKKVGNYAKGTVHIHGLTVKVENPKSTLRRGQDENGREWCQALAHDYGYLKGIPGSDGDPLDVFLGPDLKSDRVFVIYQNKRDGTFDEHKVLLGFHTPEDARQGYLGCYEAGWGGLGKMKGMSVGDFKVWAKTLRQNGGVKFDQAGPPVVPLAGAIVARISEATGALAKLEAAEEVMSAYYRAQGFERPETVVTPRVPTAHLYSHDEGLSKGKRQRANDAALALLRAVQSGERTADSLTEDDKRTLAAYSGSGGSLVNAEGRVGSDYEYYTPVPIAEGVWSLLEEMGFAGGKILDPCSGTGVFGATAPLNTVVDAVELSEISGGIGALINNAAGYTTTIAPFERVAAATPDEQYDAVVTNVPFSREVDARGGNQYSDPRYQREPMESYFVLRSLEKLKPGGLAAFIVPPRVVSGLDARQHRLRRNASLMAEFLGAYRLPNSVFGAADADTITDLIVLRKYSRPVAAKIAELMEQNAGVLHEANVLWDEFLEGRYFRGEGKRFVLGEFVPKDPTKFRDIDRVKNPASVPDIAKLMRRFPGSRVDWGLLNATETAPIIYRDGDTLYQAGQTLVMQEGRWVPVEPDESGRNGANQLALMTTAMAAFHAGSTMADGMELMAHMQRTGQALDIPGWLNRLTRDLESAADGLRAEMWTVGVIGHCVDEAMARYREGTTVAPGELYEDLTEAMGRNRSTASRLAGKFKRSRDAVALYLAHARARGELSQVWMGEEQPAEDQSPKTAVAKIDAMLYAAQDRWLPAEDVAAAIGEGIDFLSDPAWCISADGQSVMRASDYYSGRYADFLRRVDADLAEATDERVKGKILAQKMEAQSRLPRIDPAKINYDMRSPYVTDAERVEFLREYVHPAFTVDYVGDKVAYKIDVKGNELTDRIKLLKRIGYYIKEGTIKLGNTQTAMTEREALNYLRDQVEMHNAQFEIWARSHPGIQARLGAIVSDPNKLFFLPENDEAPLVIPGMNPGLALHSYQNSFVRRMGHEFGGINGDGVGLGKTSQALAAVAHVQALGVKGKTLFVVPASTLSNWQKEAGRAYTDLSRCLFVGMRPDKKTGKMKRVVSAVAEDLQDATSTTYNRIFCTFEAFESIRLRDGTIEDYVRYIGTVDPLYNADTEREGAAQRAQSQAEKIAQLLAKKTGGAPFLEDMGIDSIVIDEMHGFKNAAELNKFKGAKYLSTAPASVRGIDAMAKAWYIRGQSPIGDGVLGLTATPVTNSPLEVYSMLSLAVGHERVQAMFGGIAGADAFMEATIQKAQEPDVGLDGEEKMRAVFTGLSNVAMLQRAIHEIAVVRNAEEVASDAVVIPERGVTEARVAIDPSTREILDQYRRAYKAARQLQDENGPQPDPEDMAALDAVMERTGEPEEKIAHPFNLINRMTLAIADPELDNRATFFGFDPDQADLARKVCDDISRKNIKEEREKRSPYTPPERVTTKIKTVGTGDEAKKVQIDIVLVSARPLSQSRLVLDSMDLKTILAFEAMAEKAGLRLNTTVPAKLAAMLANYQAEQAQPRGVDAAGQPSPIVKQIVFCDILPMMHKVRRALAEHAGVPASKIAIVTGEVNGKPEEIIDVQNGFNAHGEDNAYQAIIANKKAEVGINLQVGTQAIHHLTIGWTPDSIEQRNGRGARQGNQTVRVAIYFYDAGGTFDNAKRKLVSVKGDWIDDVMSAEEGQAVTVTGGLSQRELEALINATGTDADMDAVQAAQAAANLETRVRQTRKTQVVSIKMAEKMDKEIEKLADEAVIEREVSKYVNAVFALNSAREKAGETPSDRMFARIASLEDERKAAGERVDAGLVMQEGAEHASVTAAVAALMSKYPWMESPGVTTLVVKLVAGMTDGGSIQIDQATSREHAAAMRDAARAKVAELASLAGGYPADFADKVKAGTAAILEGHGFMVGDFADVPGVNGPVLLTAAERGWDLNSAGGYSLQFTGYQLDDQESSWVSVATAQVMKGAKPVPRGTPEYVDLCARAAEIADQLQEAGEVDRANVLGNANPDIAARRTSEVLTPHSTRGVLLPAPYFPYPILPSMVSDDPVLAEIAQQQAGVIKSFSTPKYRADNAEHFYTKAGAEVREAASHEATQQAFTRALFDYCMANGRKWPYVTHPNYGYYTSFEDVIINLLTAFDWTPVAAFIAESRVATMEDVARLDEDVTARVRAVLEPALAENILERAVKFATMGNFRRVPALSESWAALAGPVEAAEQERLQRELRAAEEAKQRALDEKKKAWVCMRSDYGLTTVVKIRDFAKSMGRKAAWTGRSGPKAYDMEVARNRPDAPPNTWILPREVYTALMEQYPAQCAANHVSIS